MNNNKKEEEKPLIINGVLLFLLCRIEMKGSNNNAKNVQPYYGEEFLLQKILKSQMNLFNKKTIKD